MRACCTLRWRRRAVSSRPSATVQRRWAACDLCELHPGEADGLTWDEFRDRYGEPDFDVDPDSVWPGGRELDLVRGPRVVGLAPWPLRTTANGRDRVPRRCHRVDARGLLAVAPGRHRLRLPTEHTSLTEWEMGDDGWRLVRYNDTTPLQQA